MPFKIANVWEMTGDDKADIKFGKMPDKIQKKMLRSSLRKAGKIVQTAARGMVAKDSGALRMSIKPRAAKRSRKNKHIVAVRVMTGGRLYKGDHYPGGHVEYGTQFQSAQPFMRPAADQVRGQVIAYFKQDLKAAIAEAGKGK